jgi:hypothetical protein
MEASIQLRLIILFCMPAYFTVTIAQSNSKFIITDQFGYLPEVRKIAIIKDPQVGYDAAESFSPGGNYVVVNAITGEQVFSGMPVVWNSGSADASSGDKVWHFEFSSVTETGRYYILDKENNVRSYDFEISPIVYNEVLKHAVRSFFYQRAGFPKEARYAGLAWADGASHIGPLQDKNCRLFSDKTNPGTELDLHGGWYDAGDYNKYTNWTANYVVEMMKAYLENPKAWGDNYDIPESGNGIPDLLDEAKWGIDFLLRMQREDGRILCIVSESHASPPSSATGQSLYGPATTSASLNTAAAFAISSKVYRAMNMISYADTLLARAQKAWTWAEMYPAVIFNNNSPENSSLGVGAGNQEEDDYTRSMSKLEAACFLFDVTKDLKYLDYFDSNYANAHLITWSFAYPYEPIVQDLLLYYTHIGNASLSVSEQIRNSYRNAMVSNPDNFPAYYAGKDPYRAHMSAYTWGSNAQKGAQGTMYYNMIYFGLEPDKNEDSRDASLGYIHYIHGVNPLNMIYLSNMYSYGGDNCVNEFYHSWFCNGSAKWDRVGKSQFGPAPGYLTGGPNPSYNWAECCPGGCGSATNNAACVSETISPPRNQPKQKSYKDFNTSWPLNSWEVTENSCGYQVNYLRLLSKFVDINLDCHGDSAGFAYVDTCGICAGGNTGIIPVTDPCSCPAYARTAFLDTVVCTPPYKSPSGKYSWTASGVYVDSILSKTGCDSILNVYLNIPDINISVTQDGATLQAEASDAAFRWLQCNENYQVIEGAVEQYFTPATPGDYAVEITKHECADTSDCYSVEMTGILNSTLGEGLEIFPNPARASIMINLPMTYEKIDLELADLLGNSLKREVHYGIKELYFTLHQSKGVYFLTIRNNRNETAVMKIVLE